MFKIISEEPNLLAIQGSGSLSILDYKDVMPKIEKYIQGNKEANFVIDVRDVSGITTEAIIEDFKFSHKYCGKFGRIAIIGKKSWMDSLIEMSSKLSKAEIKHFLPKDEFMAFDWAKGIGE
ncbi:MAG: STAS/SEC14 domain-containing protein [Alphaproteobacteria bacterium]|jgi:hypothetical protein|nr:STAS/SEC14 domain-containing protein [Alphaproteobacteria bacterium]MBT5390116.1 STAS/SEC14 domain-containing protein [Alphaproteobacteria bacterium]MBT5540772.1 STAS/SEC14 domain-containing protein [Alphaproteobacteria bacterium]MBT5654622.1 STAS/SEC14 domain-containing protein [Alphaproteobacteria bacterium]